MSPTIKYTPEQRLDQIAESEVLTKIEKLVLTLRFTVTEETWSNRLEYVSRSLEVTRHEVRQLEKAAMRKLNAEVRFLQW